MENKTSKKFFPLRDAVNTFLLNSSADTTMDSFSPACAETAIQSLEAASHAIERMLQNPELAQPKIDVFDTATLKTQLLRSLNDLKKLEHMQSFIPTVRLSPISGKSFPTKPAPLPPT